MRNAIQKRFYKGFGAIVALLLCSLFLTTSCSKDPVYDAEVTVIDASTKAPVSGATIQVGPPNGDLIQNGTTDGAGKFKCSFANPAICVAYASTVVVINPFTEETVTKSGNVKFRLEEDKTVYATIEIK